MDDHHASVEDLKLQTSCHRCVLRSSLNPCTGARSVTKRNKAFDTSYVSRTKHVRQHCFARDKMEHCTLGVFQDASFCLGFPGCARKFPSTTMVGLGTGNIRIQMLWVRSLQRPSGKRHVLSHSVDHMSLDMIGSNITESTFPAEFFIPKDTEAVIRMIIKGRSPSSRHVAVTVLTWIGYVKESIRAVQVSVDMLCTTEEVADGCVRDLSSEVFSASIDIHPPPKLNVHRSLSESSCSAVSSLPSQFH